MTGRDVAIAAALGAEEFGFATAPLVTLGCAMMRVCNLDTCPFGVATQNPGLRARFRGKSEYVVNFMMFVAQELREYMSRLGVRTVDELVGRADLLKARDGLTDREKQLDLSTILNSDITPRKIEYKNKDSYDFRLSETVDEKKLAQCFELASSSPQRAELTVKNTDRAVGTMLGSAITKKYGDGLPDDTYRAVCRGAGGQSFGAFIPNGLTLELIGDSNDYFGKGLSGGRLVVYPPKNAGFKADENIIIGNVALYGATSGSAYICGIAGERFCVRNSGATAVVEGVGDHGCEYMTGGCVAVLGRTGKNFAAGMSGGIAYVLDEDNDLYTRLNKELVSFTAVSEKHDISVLKGMIEEHVKETGSVKGQEILSRFSEYAPKFKKIIPYDYQSMMAAIAACEEKGMSPDDARIEAFHTITDGRSE